MTDAALDFLLQMSDSQGGYHQNNHVITPPWSHKCVKHRRLGSGPGYFIKISCLIRPWRAGITWHDSSSVIFISSFARPLYTLPRPTDWQYLAIKMVTTLAN